MLLSEAITGVDAGFDTIRETVPPIGAHRHATPILPRRGRLVRSHELLDPRYAPGSDRVVYLMRDLRDVVVSLHDHTIRMGRPDAGIEPFCEEFLAGRVANFGPWTDHVSRALDRAASSPSSTLLVRYEDLLSDAPAQVSTILAFLGVAVGAERIDMAVANNAFDRMRLKEHESSYLRSRGDVQRPLVRQGRSGAWRTELPAASQILISEKAGPTLARAGYES